MLEVLEGEDDEQKVGRQLSAVDALWGCGACSVEYLDGWPL